jgi:CheY-like chemotaxis protein
MTDGLPFSILIVEDDEDDRIVMNEAFMEINSGEEVKKFNDGKSLFKYLEKIDPSVYPSLIVLDNTLPELDALTILSMLKENPSYKAIPVVIYTTSLSPYKKQQLLAAGAYACFEKGNTMLEIVDVAKKLRELAHNKPQEP